jgi:hypothetical protein
VDAVDAAASGASGLLQGGYSVSKTFARTTGDKSAFVDFGVPAHGSSKC